MHIRKFYLIFFLIGVLYLILFGFVSLLSNYLYKNYIRPGLDEERDFLEKRLFNEFSKLNEKILHIDSNKHTNDSPVIIIQKQALEEEKPKHDYLTRYPFYLKCKQNLDPWSPTNPPDPENYDYLKQASNSTHLLRILKAVLVYFPINQLDSFKHELRWLYRSWINMQTFEPSKWRTDLVIFVDSDHSSFKNSDFLLNELNCKFDNKRTEPTQKPMCTLISYKALKDRTLPYLQYSDDFYQHILDKTDLFSDNYEELSKFYTVLKKHLSNYNYLDSILMAFEGYKYLKSAGYDYLIRSDMDVFLTPLFARWLPRHCNDFIVGGGGYSTEFNRRRFRRIAQNLKISYADAGGLGSTWYSTPEQFRVISYLTLFGMAYLAGEEFSPPEREGKVGTILWPDWHYGVLLLYGQNVALNHLIGSKQLNVVRLSNMIDYPTANPESIWNKLHLHVYHGDDLFSKFFFSLGKYDNMSVSEKDADSKMVKKYALRMALESKRMTPKELYKKFNDEIFPKKD